MNYRGVIQPLPSLPEHEQRELLKPLRLADIYVLGRDSTHEDLIRQQRKGRALAVPWAAVLARQKGRKDSRYASLLEFVGEIHARGGHVIEVKTGLRSDRPADWRIMRAEAEKMLGRIAQGSKSAANARRGRVGFGHSDKDIQTMLRIMDSREYANDASRINAIKKLGVQPVPKRTWLITRLKLIARERGLLD
jgi:hypothetical protein